MKTCLQGFFLFLSIFLMPVSGMAQRMETEGDETDHLQLMRKFWLVAGKVKTVQGDPVRGAAVTVAPTDFRTKAVEDPTDSFAPLTSTTILNTDAQGDFRTQFAMVADITPQFSAILTVKKKGFQTAHAFVDYGQSGKSWLVQLTLHELRDEDPHLLAPADLISGLAPKLKQLGPADGLAAKSAKDYTRGVADFLDQHNSERAVPLLSKVVGNNPSCLGCRTMLGLAELGWSDMDDAKATFTEGVNATLANPDKARPEPLVAYGTWLNWQHDPGKAEPFFLEALKHAPQDALALQELGRTLVAMQQFEAATEYLKKALAAGAGPEARLLYVESCLGAGSIAEAAAEMNRYLDGRDVKKMPFRAREVWSSLQDREKVEATYAKPRPLKGHELVDFVQKPPADLIRGLEPAKDQEQLNSILDGVGAKILEMTRNFPNTSSLEAIHQEKLGDKGKLRGEQDQKFRYLCLVPRWSWGPGFTEYRADLAGDEATPKGLADGFMLTKGFASAGLIFHPTFRSESNFRYLGRQNVNGRETFVVAFAQIPGKAHIKGNFHEGKTFMTTFSQGLAWIDPDTYQIIRLHTDLLAPLHEVRLERETLNIDFNEVHFTHLKEPFWLPGQVTVTIDWNGKVLRNQHEYSDFKIFTVDASEKVGKPKGSANASPGALEPTVTP
jgi:tetratricopeptide (TPR) repeat protein